MNTNLDGPTQLLNLVPTSGWYLLSPVNSVTWSVRSRTCASRLWLKKATMLVLDSTSESMSTLNHVVGQRGSLNASAILRSCWIVASLRYDDERLRAYTARYTLRSR